MRNTDAARGTLSPRLKAFVDDIAGLQRRKPARDDLVEHVRLSLAEFVMDPTWLPAEARAGSPEHYTQHLLYVAPDRSFSVVSLVWDPGQSTPIHDHVTWCVVGVLEGHESQTLYRLVRDAEAVYLVEVGREVAPRGHCSALIPPQENIHKVANDGDARAISIHVYGADIERLGTSINQRFDDLPIRTALSDKVAVRSWREDSRFADHS